MKELGRLSAEITSSLSSWAQNSFARQVALPWVGQTINEGAVRSVLEGVAEVLKNLGAGDFDLATVEASEIEPLWVAQLQHYYVDSQRGAPTYEYLHAEIVRAVAGAIYATLRQRARHLQLLERGTPCGVRAYPSLASAEKCKSLPVAFALQGNPASLMDQRYREYQSHLLAQRRRPGARRSTGCALPSDIVRPDLYT